MRIRPLVLGLTALLSAIPMAAVSAQHAGAPRSLSQAVVAPVVPQPPAPPQAATPPASPAAPQAPKATPAAPRPPEPRPLTGANVRVDVTLTDEGGAGTTTKKSISLTVAEGHRGSVRSGVTIPVPSTTFTPAGGEGAPRQQPLTSFQYRDVGLSLDVQDVYIQGPLIRLRVAVEYNPVDEKAASQEGLRSAASSGPPSFARFSQSLTLTLEDGKPLLVAQSSDPVPGRNRTASLEVKATIVRAGTGGVR
ncbi:MAG: hypothetical protein AB1806_11990 [Acidobacteriota bacterium]